MTTVLYVCPRTGLKVQGLITDDFAAGATSVSVDCPICSSIHFVSPVSAPRQSHAAKAAAVAPPPAESDAQGLPGNMALQFGVLSAALVILLAIAWHYFW